MNSQVTLFSPWLPQLNDLETMVGTDSLSEEGTCRTSASGAPQRRWPPTPMRFAGFALLN
jgi:hypothetical protein